MKNKKAYTEKLKEWTDKRKVADEERIREEREEAKRQKIEIDPDYPVYSEIDSFYKRAGRTGINSKSKKQNVIRGRVYEYGEGWINIGYLQDRIKEENKRMREL